MWRDPLIENEDRDTLVAMRIFFTVLLCCHLAAAAGATHEPESEKVSGADVFLITIDTLRADHVHCYGYDRIQTPALDLLAQQGIRFTQAFTPSPITNSSHVSIMTGLLPSSHGVSDFGIPLAAKYPTLAALLAKGGYHGAAFLGAVILDSKNLAPGLDRGFEFYDNFPELATTQSRWGRLERRAMEVERRAESWLSSHQTGEHFVWLHFYDPHDPYEPPPPYSEVYKDRLYDGEIAYADSALNRFLTYLKNQGWYEGATIVVVGDHGEGLGEHHEDTHGIFLYDSTTRVPLIIKLPKESQAGRTVDGQVRTIDIMPTILNLLGMAAPPNLDGDSLEPLLTGVPSTPARFSVKRNTRCGLDGPRCARFDRKASSLSKRQSRSSTISAPIPVNRTTITSLGMARFKNCAKRSRSGAPNRLRRNLRSGRYPREPSMNCTPSGI